MIDWVIHDSWAKKNKWWGIFLRWKINKTRDYDVNFVLNVCCQLKSKFPQNFWIVIELGETIPMIIDIRGKLSGWRIKL